eukprot:498302_1
MSSYIHALTGYLLPYQQKWLVIPMKDHYLESRQSIIASFTKSSQNKAIKLLKNQDNRYLLRASGGDQHILSTYTKMNNKKKNYNQKIFDEWDIISVLFALERFDLLPLDAIPSIKLLDSMSKQHISCNYHKLRTYFKMCAVFFENPNRLLQPVYFNVNEATFTSKLYFTYFMIFYPDIISEYCGKKNDWSSKSLKCIGQKYLRNLIDFYYKNWSDNSKSCKIYGHVYYLEIKMDYMNGKYIHSLQQFIILACKGGHLFERVQ